MTKLKLADFLTRESLNRASRGFCPVFYIRKKHYGCLKEECPILGKCHNVSTKLKKWALEQTPEKVGRKYDLDRILGIT